MWFSSWSRNRKKFPAGERGLASRFPRRWAGFRPRTEPRDEFTAAREEMEP
jgi:hypothetical protein